MEREGEAGKWRLEDGGCRVAETREFAECASTAEMGEKAAFRAQSPSHPFSVDGGWLGRMAVDCGAFERSGGLVQG